MSDTETAPDPPPRSSSQQPQAQQGLVQHPSFGAKARIMPPGRYGNKCGAITWSLLNSSRNRRHTR